MGPTPRFGHAMAYDGARGRAVLFGGSGALPTTAASLFADTWELPAGSQTGPGAVKLDSLTATPSQGGLMLEVRLDSPAPSVIEVPIYDEPFFESGVWNAWLRVPVAPGRVTGNAWFPVNIPGRYRYRASLGGDELITTVTVT
jgi:hypothetical protein